MPILASPLISIVQATASLTWISSKARRASAASPSRMYMWMREFETNGAADVEREAVGADARAAHTAEEEEGAVWIGAGAGAGAEGGVEEEGGGGHSVEQVEGVAEVEGMGLEAVDEGVEEVAGGWRVEEEVAGGGEAGVELGGLPDGAWRRPWRRR
ncbi:Os02g0191250, partial [Oryza sativa Japonica Group]